MTDDPFDTQLNDDFVDVLDDEIAEIDSDLSEIVDAGDWDDSSDVMNIDDAVEKVYGNKPEPGVPFSMAEEVLKDEEDRRGI